jgi:hypothetical protein
MQPVRIAGLNLDIKYGDIPFCEKLFSEYIVTKGSAPDMILRTQYDEPVVEPGWEAVMEIGQSVLIRYRGRRVCRCLYDDRGDIVTMIDAEADYSSVDITLSPKLAQTDFSMADYEYYYSGFAFSDRLLTTGGAVLHGSAIAVDGQGIVFSANSGTGKSTQAGLWMSCFGARVVMINDDKPAIRFVVGRPWLYGTPWSGKSFLNANRSVPLKALIFVERAETNRLELLGARDSIFRLMSQMSRPYYDEELGLKTMSVIERLIQTVPIYLLHCTISREAVDLTYTQLVKEGVIE